MPTLDLVYNPVSGSFSERRLAKLVAALEGVGFAVRQQPSRADGIDVSEGCDLVCVHGGDGTLRDTVQALGDRAGQVPLCVAPSGTINLVARELGYARKPTAFARNLHEAWTRGPATWVHSPLYRLGDMPIVACLSIGPDSRAVARVSPTLKRRIGRYAYAAAILQQLRDWPRTPMTIHGQLASGESFECEAEAVIVSHGALYGGPFRLSPEAALKADSVELITLARSTRMGTWRLAAAAMLGRSVTKRGIAEVRTCRRIEFGQCVTPVQVDGDHMPECAFAIGPSGLTLQYVV